MGGRGQVLGVSEGVYVSCEGENEQRRMCSWQDGAVARVPRKSFPGTSRVHRSVRWG